MNLLDKLSNLGSIKSDILADSKLLHARDMIKTDIPIINVAFSGDLNGGYTSGLTVLAGPSKHFKSAMALHALKAFQNKYKDSVCLFYDSEFGITTQYLESFNIDTSKVLHVPIKNVEELKFDIVAKLEYIKRTDNVFILIDSVGNLASKKEVEDAKDEKSVADMSRAKSMKSLFRIVTPYLTINDIPLFAVAHTYDTQEMFSKKVISGGTGILYSSNTAFIIGKSQIKDGKNITGYNFILNAEKSRYVKEKSKFPFAVDMNEGISKFSGLLELALESGHIIKPSNGWYSNSSTPDKKLRAKDLDDEFWNPILNDTSFNSWINNRYKYGS
jgi:RecA/RadA recombinase